MALRISVPVLLLAAFYPSVLTAQEGEAFEVCKPVETFPGKTMEAPPDPASLGWDRNRLENARRQFAEMESAAMVVLHRGHVIAQWGEAGGEYLVQSVRKSFLNALIGKLVATGHLNLDSTLESLGIDDTDPPLKKNERQVTVRDLLLSRSGIFHPALYEASSWKEQRRMLDEREAERGEKLYQPGEFWIYNNWDFNALGTIFENVSGRSIGAAFEQDVAAKIGMEDFEASDVMYIDRSFLVEWWRDGQSDHRAYLFKTSARDMARFGLLYLNCGTWEGEEVIPAEWVKETVLAAKYTLEGNPARKELEKAGAGRGSYGYLWWVDAGPQKLFSGLNVTQPFYYASGGLGHFILVIPEYDLVISHTIATSPSVSSWGQLKRRLLGQPEIEFRDFLVLVNLVLAAHPSAEPKE